MIGNDVGIANFVSFGAKILYRHNWLVSFGAKIKRGELMIKETEHFITYYHVEDDNLVEQFIALLEEKYERLYKDFAIEKSSVKYEFHICKDVDEYIEKTGKTKAEYQSWMVGNSNVENHTITILSPNVVEEQSLEEMKKIAIHELVHMIFDDATKVAEDDVEGWIAEGIAILYSEQTELDYVSLSDYPLIADISGEFDNFVDNGGYDYAGIYVSHFIEKYGFESFVSVYSGKAEISDYIYKGFEKEAIERFVKRSYKGDLWK